MDWVLRKALQWHLQQHKQHWSLRLSRPNAYPDLKGKRRSNLPSWVLRWILRNVRPRHHRYQYACPTLGGAAKQEDQGLENARHVVRGWRSLGLFGRCLQHLPQEAISDDFDESCRPVQLHWYSGHLFNQQGESCRERLRTFFIQIASKAQSIILTFTYS